MKRFNSFVLAIIADIASKQTDFDLFMNDDCYQHNLLTLSYKYLY